MCKTYQDIKCNSIYLDENYEYPINKNVEFTGYTESDLTPPDNNNNDIEEPTLGFDVDKPTKPTSSSAIEQATNGIDDLLEVSDNDVSEKITDPVDEMDVTDSESDSEVDHDDDNVRKIKIKNVMLNINIKLREKIILNKKLL